MKMNKNIRSDLLVRTSPQTRQTCPCTRCVLGGGHPHTSFAHLLLISSKISALALCAVRIILCATSLLAMDRLNTQDERMHC